MSKATSRCSNRLFEWCSALILVQCGMLAVVSSVILDEPPQLAFTAFANLGLHQVVTGLIFFTTGGARCFALWRNGQWPNGPMVRVVCALVGAVIWSQLLFSILEVLFYRHLLYMSLSVWSTLLIFEGMSFTRALSDRKSAEIASLLSLKSNSAAPTILGIGNEP